MCLVQSREAVCQFLKKSKTFAILLIISSMSYLSAKFCLSNLESKQYEGRHASPVQCGVPRPQAWLAGGVSGLCVSDHWPLTRSNQQQHLIWSHSLECQLQIPGYFQSVCCLSVSVCVPLSVTGWHCYWLCHCGHWSMTPVAPGDRITHFRWNKVRLGNVRRTSALYLVDYAIA